jgi:hypothetical protein
MTLFLDNDLSPALAEVLRQVDADAVHLREKFDPATPDEEWLPRVAREGWVLVTADERMRKRPAQRLVLQACGITGLFLFKGFLRLQKREQVAWFVKHLTGIEEQVGRLPAGTSARIHQNGKVEPLR